MTLKLLAAGVAALITGVAVFLGCDKGKQLHAAEPSIDVARFASAADLGPETLPYEQGSLILAGTSVKVKLVEKREPNRVAFQIIAQDEMVEEEVYEYDQTGFRFAASNFPGSGEMFEPAIPLVRYPLDTGDSWEWKGNMSYAKRPYPASATITSASERLNLAGGQFNTVRIDVMLKVETGGGQVSDKKLIFWIQPKQGVVKRQFGGTSTREPRPVEPEATE